MQGAIETNSDIDFSYYIDVLLRRRWIILSIAAVISLCTALKTFTTPPVYNSQALLVIEKERTGSNSGIYREHGGVESTQQDYYATQFKLLKSYTLLEKVYEQLALNNTEDFKGGVEALDAAIEIIPLRGTRLLHVGVDSHEPELTALIANTLAEIYVKQNLSNQLFISQDILKVLKSGPKSSDGEFAASALPAIVGNELIQQLKRAYISAQAQKAELSRRYKKRHPAMASLDSQMATLQAQIDKETANAIQSLKAELSGQLKGNNVRIVDPARIPRRPYKPNKVRGVGIGLAVGLIAGIFVAFLIEVLDQSIRTQEDVEKKLHIPSLGVIPHLPQDDNRPVYEPLISNKLSLSSEAFRNMRTMVDLAGVSETSNEFLITSTVQSEGKTHVAANLAVAFSQMGQTVLL
ncbi:MAG: Wzz/FepE/Etk N-terminal domain-containing protein, partial [Elusimicrobiota bacterium]